MTSPRVAIFDSGIGGLTVASAIAARMPHAHLRYLGDTARLPYGTKSARTVQRYALQAARQLLREPADALVIACNTASAVAVDVLAAELALPVWGVVEPGAAAAVARCRTGHIGVIGTERTIATGAYHEAIARIAPSARVHGLATPLLVALAEEGWFDHPATEAVVEAYLHTLLASPEAQALDTLVLGCTHYPVFKRTIGALISERLDRPVALIDSADAIADALEAHFGPRPPHAPLGQLSWLCTDDPERFARVGARFFADLSASTVEVVDL
jgi:glutamate racemase